MRADDTIFELRPGERVGDYVVGKKIGEGGMGYVYAARGAATNQTEVALKVMHPRAAAEPVLCKRFLREAQAMMALDHPNVVKIVACFQHDERPVIAMELLKGRTLGAHLLLRGKLGLAETSEIFVRVTSALGTAHALGLVHRDMKPDNVFLLDEFPFAKVLDFGIAKLNKGGVLQETSPLTVMGARIGTPLYMPPEQAFGEADVDHRADIWSIGVMLYQSLTGVLPTDGNSMQEVMKKLLSPHFTRIDALDPALPSAIATLVERMLAQDPAHRPRDLREVYEVLAHHTRKSVLEESRSFAAATLPIVHDELSDTAPNPFVEAIAEYNRAHAMAPAARHSTMKLAPAPLPSNRGARASGTLLAADLPVASDPLSKTAPDSNLSTLNDPGIRASQPIPSGRRPTTPWTWYAVALGAVVALILLLLVVTR